jgi:hypothetical protein
MLAASTSTPSRRLFFVGFVVGIFMLTISVVVWSGEPRHSILARWDRAPDRAAEGQPGHRAFVNIERSCKWQTTPPANYNPLARGGPVPFSDVTYSVDGGCIRNVLGAQESYASAPATLAAALPRPQSAVELFRFHSATRPWNSEEPLKGDLQLYREQLMSSLGRIGVEPAVQVAASEQCVQSIPKWCVVSESEYYSDAGSIISETPSIQLSLAVTLLGALGSFFSAQVTSVWRFTFGRLFQWVKGGR